MSRLRWASGIAFLRWLIILGGLIAGCWLGLYADVPGAPMPEVMHALATVLIGTAAATGLLRHFPFSVVATVMAVLLGIIVILAPGQKHLGYELCAIIVMLAVTVVQLVLPQERR